MSGGTHNHLFLLDLIDKDITGKDADAALGRANITVNKNSVPNDPRSPFVTSGLRIGTPALTRRGFDDADARELTGWIATFSITSAMKLSLSALSSKLLSRSAPPGLRIIFHYLRDGARPLAGFL